jgi:hypothetical protein
MSKLIMKQFKNGEEVEDHIKFILQLIDKYTYEEDKNAYILLRGYIIKHVETCEEIDCPLKLYMKKQERKKKKMRMNIEVKASVEDELSVEQAEITEIISMLDV